MFFHFEAEYEFLLIEQREATGDVTFKIVPSLRSNDVEEKKVKKVLLFSYPFS